jgi:hypothetical protein
MATIWRDLATNWQLMERYGNGGWQNYAKLYVCDVKKNRLEGRNARK